MIVYSKDVKQGPPQAASVFLRKCSRSNVDKVVVKSCVGAFRRADGQRGEVEVCNGVGGDGGDHGGGLPVPVGLADQRCCTQEAEAHHKNPEKLPRFGLIRQKKHSFLDFVREVCNVTEGLTKKLILGGWVSAAYAICVNICCTKKNFLDFKGGKWVSALNKQTKLYPCIGVV